MKYKQMFFLFCILLIVVMPYLAYCTISSLWHYVRECGTPTVSYLLSHIKFVPEQGLIISGIGLLLLLFLYVSECCLIFWWFRKRTEGRALVLVAWTVLAFAPQFIWLYQHYLYILRTA